MKIVKIDTLDGKNVEAAVHDEDYGGLNSFLKWNREAIKGLLEALREIEPNHEIVIKYDGDYE